MDNNNKKPGGGLEFLQTLDRNRDWSLEILKSSVKAEKESSTNGLSAATAPVQMSKSKRKKTKKRMKKLKDSSAGSVLKRESVPTVVFIDPAKSGGEKESLLKRKLDSQNTANDERPDLDLKKAKFEIIKFGFNSMKGLEKEDAETAFAISLGARAPKSLYVNYKDLQEKRKKEKEVKAQEDQERFKQKINLKKGDRLKNRSSKNRSVKQSKAKKNPGGASSYSSNVSKKQKSSSSRNSKR